MKRPVSGICGRKSSACNINDIFLERQAFCLSFLSVYTNDMLYILHIDILTKLLQHYIINTTVLSETQYYRSEEWNKKIGQGAWI